MLHNKKNIHTAWNIIVMAFFLLICSHIALSDDLIPECGPNSLLAICDFFGISASFEELCDLSGYDENFGTSMLGIYKAAISKGLNVKPLKLTYDDLCNYKNPTIVFVDGNHFFVVLGCKDNYLTIEDRPKLIYNLSKEKFLKRWDGTALVFINNKENPKIKNANKSKKNIEEIKFDSYVKHFGTIQRGQILSHTFKLKNNGSNILSIKVRPSCSCTAASLSQNEIQPGMTGEITASYNSKRRKGSDKVLIYVRTNNPSCSLIILTLTAIVKDITSIEPDNIIVDILRKGESVTRYVYVIDSGNGMLNINKIDTPESVSAQYITHKSSSAPLRKIPIQLNIFGDNYGRFEKIITVHTNDKLVPKIDVPIVGNVIGNIEAYPSRLFLGELKINSDMSKEIIIKSTNKKHIEVINVKTKSPYLSTKIITTDDDLSKKIQVIVNTPDNNSTIRDNILVYTNNKSDADLTIPLFAKVVER